MIKFLLLIIVFCLPSISKAEYAPINYVFTVGTQQFTSPVSACQHYISLLDNRFAYVSASLSGNNAICNYTLNGNPNQTTFTGFPDCSPNILQPNGMCSSPTCTPPQVLNSTGDSCENVPCVPPQVAGTNGQCYTPQCELNKGKLASAFSNTASGSVCLDGCLGYVQDGHCGTNSTGQQGCFYTVETSATECSQPNQTPPQTTSDGFDCIKQGKSFGLVNGVAVCVANGTPNTPPVTTVDKNKTTSSTTENGTTSNTTKESTSTTNPNGTVTTNTTTTNPDGTVKTETKTEDKTDFCTNNPNSKVCQEGKTACDENPEGPECKHFCDKFPESLACVKPADYIGDPDSLSQDLPQTSNINLPTTIANISLPQNNTCPPDYSVTISGYTIPFSYAWLCDYASSFKPLVIAMAFLSASLIVFGSIKQQGT